MANFEVQYFESYQHEVVQFGKQVFRAIEEAGKVSEGAVPIFERLAFTRDDNPTAIQDQCVPSSVLMPPHAKMFSKYLLKPFRYYSYPDSEQSNFALVDNLHPSRTWQYSPEVHDSVYLPHRRQISADIILKRIGIFIPISQEAKEAVWWHDATGSQQRPNMISQYSDDERRALAA